MVFFLSTKPIQLLCRLKEQSHSPVHLAPFHTRATDICAQTRNRNQKKRAKPERIKCKAKRADNQMTNKPPSAIWLPVIVVFPSTNKRIIFPHRTWNFSHNPMDININETCWGVAADIELYLWSSVCGAVPNDLLGLWAGEKKMQPQRTGQTMRRICLFFFYCLIARQNKWPQPAAAAHGRCVLVHMKQ